MDHRSEQQMEDDFNDQTQYLEESDPNEVLRTELSGIDIDMDLGPNTEGFEVREGIPFSDGDEANADFIEKRVKAIIKEHEKNFAHHLDEDEFPEGTTEEHIYIVWKAKVLQNWKVLASTSVPNGLYYEITHNGDKNETYVDIYAKTANLVIPNGQDKE